MPGAGLPNRLGLGGPIHAARAAALLSSTLSASGPAQGAIAEFLEQGGYDRHLRRLRDTLQTLQARMATAVAHAFPAGTRMTRPQGGFFLWLELPQGIDALALHRQALARGISVAPGPIFSASGQFARAAPELRPPLEQKPRPRPCARWANWPSRRWPGPGQEPAT